MKKTRLFLLLLPVLLFAVLWAVVGYKRSTPAYILAQYPKSAAFDSIVQSHLTEETQMPANSRKLFYSTWFHEGRTNVAMQCIVDNKGQMLTYRDVYSWAIQASHSSQLKPAQLTSLRTALPNLPSSAETPRLGNLLILSFRNGKTWTTRIYDRANLPKDVTKIYKTIGALKITGAPMETAK